MVSVTGRISEIKQPRGGYIKPSEFESITYDDGILLHSEENIHASIIGLAVDYLTRLLMGAEKADAFRISLLGAKNANELINNSWDIANRLLNNINGLDEKSIINTCKLATFDVWFRNPKKAMLSKNYEETNPDKFTIENIVTLVNRSLRFFDTYGPILKDGFTFEPHGYTVVVTSGDGDFLTKDTLWDFKVSKSKPTNKHTLQLLMYWIMGQHSGQEIFKNINKLGIFNPRLNTVYLLDILKIDQEIIKTVESEVICY